MKDVLRVTLVALATAALLLILWRFRGALLLFFMAVVLSAMLAPAFRWLQQFRMPRLLVIGTVYGMILLVFVILSFTIYDALLRDLSRIVGDLEEVQEYIVEHWSEGNAARRYVAAMFPPPGQPLFDASLRNDLAGSLAGLGSTLTRWIILAFLVVVVSIYWSIEYFRLERLWLLLLPLQYRARVRQVWRQVLVELGNHLRIELLQGLAIALVIGVVFAWIGFPYPVILGLVIAGTSLISWLGAFLAVIAVWSGSLLNFVDVTPLAGIVRGLVGSGIALIVFTSLKFLGKRCTMRRERYSSFLLIIVTVGTVQAFGAIGIIVGPPISIVIQIVVRYLFVGPWDEERGPPPVDLDAMRQRVHELQRRAGALDRTRRVPLENMLQDASQLIDDAGEVISQAPRQE